MAAYVLVLLFFFGADRRGAWSIDWSAAGVAQAGLIGDGAWWRTLTALTLHADHGHLLGNLAAGSAFGSLAARLLGPGLAWLALLLAGALGNLLNAALQPPGHTAVGAPTALFGALGIVSGHTRQRRPMPWRGGLRRWAPLAAGVMLLVYLGWGGERTDVGGHVAGFAAGTVLGFALGRCSRPLPRRPRAQGLYGLLACGLLALAWLLAPRGAG
jgi:membrane associated rhomboid family serine protease